MRYRWFRQQLTWRKYCTGTTARATPQSVDVNGRQHISDDYTNVTPKILSYLHRNLHLEKGHPLCLLRESIVDYFYKNYVNVKSNPIFSVHERLNPVVSVQQNFESLLIPDDHPSRAKGDCYYINRHTLLRGHTTAHQADLLRSGLDNFLIIGDVYRRDEIDSKHFPVFHQLDGVRSQTRDTLFPDQPDLDIFERAYRHCKKATGSNEQGKQSCHTLEAVKVMEYQLKHALVGLVKHLFGEYIDYRWVDAQFPFTQPSWELEVFFAGDWMEVAGCGITKNDILAASGAVNSIAFAFGLGLERIAMALYEIPDIRLFWSLDSGFLNQFREPEPGRRLKYRAVSTYPQAYNDVSFWLAPGRTIADFDAKDLCEMIREEGGDVVEQVSLRDSFVSPQGRSSLCYRIVYRHMERTLTQEEVGRVHRRIEERLVRQLNVTIR